MDIAAVRDGIRTRLATISGLHALDRWPDNVIPPTAIVAPERVLFDNTMGRGGDNATFVVRVLVGRVEDAAAQDLLDTYLAGSGSASVKTAIEADATLGAAADTCRVSEARGYGFYEHNGVKYLGCEFVIQVID